MPAKATAKPTVKSTAPASPRRLIYLYGIAPAESAATLSRRLAAVRGVEGTSGVRVVSAAAGVVAIVSDVPASAYAAAARRQKVDLEWLTPRALGHERVLDAAMRVVTVIPVSFLTLFSSEAALVARLQADRARNRRLLTQLAGCEEWSVVVTAIARRGPAPTSGRAYLERRSSALGGRDAATLRAAAARLARGLAAAARAEKRDRLPAGAVALGRHHYLIERARRPEFRSALAAARVEARRTGLALSASGPWPPYRWAAKK